MKQKYEFYLTGEEQRQFLVRFNVIDTILSFIFLYLYYAFGMLLLIGRSVNLTIEDTYMKVLIMLSLVNAIPLFISIIFDLLHLNFCPIKRMQSAKQIYIVDGDKMTINMIGVTETQTSSFTIKKTKETNIGTVYYKSKNYYVVIPHRVKPVEVE